MLNLHRLKSIVIVGTFLWGLAGCSETALVTQHYFLGSPEVPSGLSKQAPRYPQLLLVKKVTSMPPYNTTNVVLKLRTAEVRFYNYAKWVSPPDEMIHHYLTRSLTFSQLAEVATARKSQREAYYLDVEVQEFAQVFVKNQPHGSLTLFVGMSHTRSKTYDWYRVYNAKIPAKSDQPYDVALALNRGVKQITQALLQDLELFLASQ